MILDFFVNTFPNRKLKQMYFLWIKSDKAEQLCAAARCFCFFCKKMTHLFNAHMPQLPQIARSTVLHMQIWFAWKSIWSCSKESRTVLLLSPPPPPCGAPAPLAWKTFSPAPLACTRSQWRLLASRRSFWGQYADSHGPCPRAEQEAPQLFVQLDKTCSAGTQGIITQSVFFFLC